MKKQINIFDHANKILNGLKQGALLTTKAGGKVNTMTISWGTIGIEWGKPIFITFVREHRLTREMLDEHGEFTVSIPAETSDRKIGGFCGMHSGRDIDKIKQLNLTLTDSEHIDVPGIREYPIILECRLLYRQKQELSLLPAEIVTRDYPETVDSSAPLANKDCHTAYYGEIVNAYIIED